MAYTRHDLRRSPKTKLRTDAHVTTEEKQALIDMYGKKDVVVVPQISWFNKFISIFGIGDWAKYQRALKNKNPKYCKGISSDSLLSECLEETIMFNEDPNLCDDISIINSRFAHDQCYTKLALSKNDISYCELVGPKDEKECLDIAK